MNDSLLPNHTLSLTSTSDDMTGPSAQQTLLDALTGMLRSLPKLLQSNNSLDAGQAAQLLHQTGRAMEVAQLPALTRLIQAMEEAVRAPAFTHNRSEPSASDSVTPSDVLNLAARDALEYLEQLQSGQQPAASHLFTAYRAVCKLGGKDSAHPADLWEQAWSLACVPEPLPEALQVPPVEMQPQTRAVLDQLVLSVVKTADPQASAQLRDTCLGLAITRALEDERALWQIAGGCFDAGAHGLVEHDLYTKRLASRVLMYYASAYKAQLQSSTAPLPNTLVRDMLFACAQALSSAQALALPVSAVLKTISISAGLAKATDFPEDISAEDALQSADAPAPEGLDLSHLVFDETAPASSQEVDHAEGDATDTLSASTTTPSAQVNAANELPSVNSSEAESEAVALSHTAEAAHADSSFQQMDEALDFSNTDSADIADADNALDSSPGGELNTQITEDLQDSAANQLREDVSALQNPDVLSDEQALESHIPESEIFSLDKAASPLAALSSLLQPAVPEVQPVNALLQGQAGQPQAEPNQAFLAEADTLSQALQSLIQQWAEASDNTEVPASAIEHARVLTRSAWSAGCTDISLLTHTLQTVMERIRHGSTPEQRMACVHAADEVMRLLHQFAAGFVRRPHPPVMEALRHIMAETHVSPVVDNEADTNASLTETEHDASLDPAPVVSEESLTDPEEFASEAPSATATAQRSTEAIPAAVDQLEPVRFSVFEDEVLATWPKLQAALHVWMESPATATDDRHALLRHLHTLKGSARLAGAAAWASQVHALEDLASLAQANDGPLGPQSLQQPLEVLRLAFVALQQEMAAQHPERAVQHWGSSPMEAVGRHAQALWSSHEQTAHAASEQSMTIQELGQCLDKLRGHLKDCAAWADTLVLHGDMDLSYEWHEELHALIRALGDSTDDIGTVQQQLQHGQAAMETALSGQAGHLRALQHTMLYARLMPLAMLHDRLHATVELAGKDTGKEVLLHMEGAEQLLDRAVAEQLTPALEHLLRNCVDHGIESKEERTAKGKPTAGQLRVQLRTEGSVQYLTVSDDGAGLHIERIRSKAVALGLIAEDESIDAARAAELILLPGLSTAPQITELSGRGIGMDAVQATVQALGGQLHIHSNAHAGCEFILTLPAPPQVEQVVALRAGSFTMAVPARTVESVRRIPHSHMLQAAEQGMLPDDISGPMPLYWAGAVWQQSQRSNAPALDGMCTVLIVRNDTSRWALQVDEVLGTQEVALQPATDIAVPLPGLLGMAAQASGQVMQVYDPYAALADHEARRLLQAQHPTSETAAPEMESLPLILVADDSTSVRRLAQHLLQSNGYRVETAADGLQALHMLEQQEMPALLLADIEMPEMDGLDLLRRIRSDARLRQLPVVMLTAHAAGPLSQKAIDSGAQAFLTKPYAPNELLALVRRCAVATTASSTSALAVANPTHEQISQSGDELTATQTSTAETAVSSS